MRWRQHLKSVSRHVVTVDILALACILTYLAITGSDNKNSGARMAALNQRMAASSSLRPLLSCSLHQYLRIAASLAGLAWRDSVSYLLAARHLQARRYHMRRI